MVHILAAGSLTIDFVRFFTDLNTAEEKYHANLHENAESNNPEPSSGVVTSMCCCVRVHTYRQVASLLLRYLYQRT